MQQMRTLATVFRDTEEFFFLLSPSSIFIPAGFLALILAVGENKEPFSR